jgi:hypothetical protein
MTFGRGMRNGKMTMMSDAGGRLAMLPRRLASLRLTDEKKDG